MAVPKHSPATRKFEADERQREAIEHFEGPILVVAGAGTGKTTVLTRRIAHLTHEHGVRPGQILALTYADNAAREMSERVRADLSSGAPHTSGVQVVTFHAYCNELLIRSGRQFGLLDDKDIWIYLRKRLRELRLEHFVKAANLGKFLNDLLGFMRRCQDELVSAADYSQYVARLEKGELPLPRVTKSKGTNKDKAALTNEEVLARCQEIARVYSTVESMLLHDNLGTFGHQITRAHALLTENAGLLAQERTNARFILVDEFQDANFAQVKILQLLAGPERNIFAVGDPDQAIYRFRGASSSAFALFDREFPGAKLVVLEKNRRSTTPILQCAFALISKNVEAYRSGRLAALASARSPLISAREEVALSRGESIPRTLVDVAALAGKYIECHDLVVLIQQKQKSLRCPWSDFAVLYRQHEHRSELVAELTESGIPFSIDNVNVMDTPEARDLFACLGAVVATADTASLFRVSALPQFRIQPEQLRTAMRSIRRQEQSAGLAVVLPSVAGGPQVLAALQQTRDEIESVGAKGRKALEIIVQRFALDPTSRHLQAVLKFVGEWEKKAITKTGRMGELIEYLDLFREAGGSICMASPEGNAVRLMTAHTAKGLEFNHVFIIRANSPSFPSSYKETLVEFPRELRQAELASGGDEKTLNDQEERRLFYVAMTRARDSLTIYAKQGTGQADKSPPGFLRELVKDNALKNWMRQRQAIPFQVDLFAESATPAASRTAQWLSMPAVDDLGRKLSATAVQRYEICPLKFKLEREWNLPSEVSAALQYGGAMHRVLKTYYDAIGYDRPFSEEDVLDLFRVELAGVGMQDPYQRDLYEANGLDQLKAFVRASSLAPPHVLHSEESFEVRIGNTVVVGRIDRIDRLPNGHVAITDYKTGKPQSQEDADDSLQLSIYAVAAQEKWGYVADRLMLYNLQENAAVTTQRSDAELAAARQKVQEVATKIAQGEFDAKPGFYCNFCSYQNLCPATEQPAYVEPSTGKPAQSKVAGRRG